MAGTETTTQESIALEHGFSLPLIVLVIAACSAVLLWSLYRERHVLQRRLTILFGALRFVAIAAVLWMLLGPTSVVEQSSTTRKAVAIVADVSASMTTIDPPGTADDARWAASQNASKLAATDDQPSVVWADRGGVAMGVAERELASAVTELDQHGTQSLVTEHVLMADKAVGRAKQHLALLQGAVPKAAEPLLDRLSNLLSSPEFDSLSELATTLRKDRTPTESGWREGLADLVGRTVTVQRVFQELGKQLARDETSANLAALRTLQSRPRSERVAALLAQLNETALAEVTEDADLHWTTFGSSATDVASETDAVSELNALSDRDDLANQTDLSAALSHVDRLQQNQPVAATIIFSDVAHNDPEARSPTDIASQFDESPVYIVPVGNPARRRDIDLVSISSPAVAMRNDDVVIEAQIEAYQCLGDTCVVQLMSDGEVLDFRNVPIDSESASRSVQFDYRVSEIGTAAFQIAVQPLDDEMTAENNFAEVEINVTRSDIKVLLADNLPRWEYRYLAQLFRRDPKVEVDELLYHPRMIATGRREAAKSFPITVDDWDLYDVVILGDIVPEQFPHAAQESLLQYVRTRGGTVVLIAGDRAMPAAYVDDPLATLVPVRPTTLSQAADYAFHVTEQGKSHIALMIAETTSSTRDSWDFINKFSPLQRVSNWRAPLPSATSLIAAVPRKSGQTVDKNIEEESTFLCWQPVGRGRAIYLSAPDTYRLRFLRGDHLHYRFWGQLMRWAIASELGSGNQFVRIRTGKTVYETNRPVDVEVELFDADGGPIESGSETEDLAVKLVAGEHERIVSLLADTDRPGHYRVDIETLPPGVYTAEPAGSLVASLLASDADSSTSDPVAATFTVQADLPTELVDTRSNRALASQIAELTGGQVLAPTAIHEVLHLTNLEPIVSHSVQRQPLWLRWRYLWLIFGCLQLEWMIRKWRGLS